MPAWRVRMALLAGYVMEKGLHPGAGFFAHMNAKTDIDPGELTQSMGRKGLRPAPRLILEARAMAISSLSSVAGVLGLLGVLAGGSPAAGAGPRLLLLGDSHCLGPFGETLDRSLRAEGFELSTYACSAGGPYFWLEKHQSIAASLGAWEKTASSERREDVSVSAPKVEALLRQSRPEVVVVQAGLELYPALRLGTAETRAHVRRVVDEFCRSIAEAKAWTYWVLPPRAHPKRVPPALQGDLADLIREIVERYGGGVFDSGAVTDWSVPYPVLSDGLHYGVVEARQWAEAVLSGFQAYRRSLLGRDGPPLPSRVEPAPEELEPGLRPPGAVRARVIASLGSAEASDELQVKVVLRRKTSMEDSLAVEGGNAFGMFEYEVEKVYQGAYAGERLRVAHLLLLNAQLTMPNRFEVGREYYLSLIRMEKYPSLDTIPLVSQLEPDANLPVYICRF